MHEIGLCEPIIDAVQRQAAGRRVAGVRVRVGARHAVVPDAFEQAFAMVADGTVADGAAVDLVVTPPVAACHSCGHRTETTDPLAACAGCGAAGLEMTGGDELVLESIELDGAEPRDEHGQNDERGEKGAADVSRDPGGDRRDPSGQP